MSWRKRNIDVSIDPNTFNHSVIMAMIISVTIAAAAITDATNTTVIISLSLS